MSTQILKQHYSRTVPNPAQASMLPNCHPPPASTSLTNSSLPSQCLTSTILIPLVTWLYLFFLTLTLFLTPLLARRTSAPLLTKPPSSGSPGTLDSGPTSQPRHRNTLRALWILHVLLLVAQLAMISLELARLVAADIGVALLPFSYVGILLAGAIRWRSRGAQRKAREGGKDGRVDWRALGWVGVGWWVLLGVLYAVGAAVEARAKVGDGKGGREMYPSDDQVTDRATIAGVAVVLAVLEGVGSVLGG
ncbi:MAG: hypothetical protein MMC23_004565 [Stictis urceolatum]|nr:hypothetical protein [Stictis urceolata]